MVVKVSLLGQRLREDEHFSHAEPQLPFVLLLLRHSHKWTKS